MQGVKISCVLVGLTLEGKDHVCSFPSKRVVAYYIIQ